MRACEYERACVRVSTSVRACENERACDQVSVIGLVVRCLFVFATTEPEEERLLPDVA